MYIGRKMTPRGSRDTHMSVCRYVPHCASKQPALFRLISLLACTDVLGARGHIMIMMMIIIIIMWMGTER
jgi:hypothetical protein